MSADGAATGHGIDPASPNMAASLLRQVGVVPKKRFGQNFLCDGNVLARIADAAGIAPADGALEIGPGLGALTLRLADRARHVTAVEIDAELLPALQKVVTGRENITVVHADFLRVPMEALLSDAFGSEPGVVVANIPYNITAPIVERLIEHKARIRSVTLLVQKEVADRMAAAAGAEAYGSFSVFCQFHARVTLCGAVSRRLFIPAPDVESAIVRLDMVAGGTETVCDAVLMEAVVRSAFGQRRKNLRNALNNAGLLPSREALAEAAEAAGIDLMRRGETLSVREFASLTDAIAAARATAG
ncbi:MAG: 16S rRNA (adenine(1518)-N(6)/adenine(1519)-N(6))-dimethyltransferase RsmA [Armatimonadetes bacterium]|nr:16S rRNA (adenine(1518)-N(6)/adenine(1519)-N(6))-dimethyltransferase RsmA [Armatimonadota bacterium]